MSEQGLANREWRILYPAYINANRTLHEGRRMAKSKCVPDPRWQEMKDVLEANRDFRIMAEPNALYPRELDKELPTARGRIKYQVVSGESPFQKKEAVLEYLGDMIPKLKSRAKTASTSASGAGDQPPPGNKRKGKGKK
jgi:signal recognition particle subunit SEC65